jgi:hypothetical protein
VKDSGGKYEPRVIRTGLARYDYTEVIEGVEEGEQVVLITSAQLQKAQQDMRNAARARSGGPLGGGNPGGGFGQPPGGGGGGRGGGNPGGGGGGGGGRGGRGGGN